MRHVSYVLVLGLALSSVGGAASADQCSQATAIAFNKLREAISLSTVLKPDEASNPVMCPAAHRVLDAYVQHLRLFERRQVECRSMDPNAITALQSSIDRIRTVVIRRYCR